MSRAWRISFSLYTVPLFFHQSKGAAIFYPCPIVPTFGIHTFSWQSVRSVGQSESLLRGRRLGPETAVSLFSEWISELLVQVYGNGGEEGSETPRSQMAGWGLHNTSVF